MAVKEVQIAYLSTSGTPKWNQLPESKNKMLMIPKGVVVGTKIIYTCDVCNRTVDSVRKFVHGVQDAPTVIDACESCSRGVSRAISDGIKTFSSTLKDDVKLKAGKGK